MTLWWKMVKSRKGIYYKNPKSMGNGNIPRDPNGGGRRTISALTSQLNEIKYIYFFQSSLFLFFLLIAFLDNYIIYCQ